MLSIALVLACCSLAAGQGFAPPVEPSEQQPETAPKAQPSPEPETQPSPEPEPVAHAPMRDAFDRVANLHQRLADLDGSDAMVYIELAEEVTSETGSPQDRDLARQLFTSAYHLELSTERRPEVLAGACLGLAMLEPGDEGAAWLVAVASIIDPRVSRGSAAGGLALAVTPEVALAAANALGLARSGEGRRAARIYEDPAVKEVFERYGVLLGGTGGLSGVARFERALRDWPDLECGGARVITRRGEGGVIETQPCPICNGNPGPPMTEAEYLAQLRFESRLLRGIHQSWGAQVAADGGAPLLDPDPQRVPELLAARYRVVPERRLWRDGQWLDPDPDGADQTPPSVPSP